jgi:hypothetical protein
VFRLLGWLSAHTLKVKRRISQRLSLWGAEGKNE